MREEERRKIFRENLLRITQEGGRGNFLIFGEPTDKRFVQFVGDAGREEVFCDVPVAGNRLGEVELRKLEAMGFSMDSEVLESYGRGMGVEEAAEATERIFREVFGLPPDYGVAVTLELTESFQDFPQREDWLELSEEIGELQGGLYNALLRLTWLTSASLGLTKDKRVRERIVGAHLGVLSALDAMVNHFVPPELRKEFYERAKGWRKEVEERFEKR
jgi:hypothetical protein